MMLNRKLRAALAALGLVGGTLALGVAVPATASAATGCPSGATNVYSYPYYNSAGQLAAVGYVYAYRADVCIGLTSQGPYYGVRKYMSAWITQSWDGKSVGDDSGYYLYYAGPVSYANGDGAMCFDYHFYMLDASGHVIVNDDESPQGCD
ncbi:MAG TPA: hypothetical protein VFN97_21430 [Actinospica sp.]|nr:hypothetical protein [Actinospica sp.]